MFRIVESETNDYSECMWYVNNDNE